jgi:flagellar hook assembly protein FlgD
VGLNIYNAAGQVVRTLVDEEQAPRAGGHTVRWDGRDDNGRPVASGVYLYRLTSGGESRVRKLVLVR